MLLNRPVPFMSLLIDCIVVAADVVVAAYTWFIIGLAVYVAIVNGVLSTELPVCVG